MGRWRGKPDGIPTQHGQGIFITITTWNIRRITGKLVVKTQSRGCFPFFFLKFGDVKWIGRDGILFRLSPGSRCRRLCFFEISPKTISTYLMEEHIPHHTWDPHRHALASTWACTLTRHFQMLACIPSPHVRMHTQRGLSGQGQRFSLWESKAVTLLSLWIDYLSILFPDLPHLQTRSGSSAMRCQSPCSFIAWHLAEFIITRGCACLFD